MTCSIPAFLVWWKYHLLWNRQSSRLFLPSLILWLSIHRSKSSTPLLQQDLLDSYLRVHKLQRNALRLFLQTMYPLGLCQSLSLGIESCRQPVVTGFSPHQNHGQACATLVGSTCDS